jgi:hypothetical protein
MLYRLSYGIKILPASPVFYPFEFQAFLRAANIAGFRELQKKR